MLLAAITIEIAVGEGADTGIVEADVAGITSCTVSDAMGGNTLGPVWEPASGSVLGDVMVSDSGMDEMGTGAATESGADATGSDVCTMDAARTGACSISNACTAAESGDVSGDKCTVLAS